MHACMNATHRRMFGYDHSSFEHARGLHGLPDLRRADREDGAVVDVEAHEVVEGDP